MPDNSFAHLADTPAADSDNSFAHLDAEPQQTWADFLRNNKFTRLSNQIEHGATFGLNTEVAPVTAAIVAAGKRALGYDSQTPGEAYSAAKQKELDKNDYARKEFGALPSIVGGMGSLGSGAKAVAEAPGYFSGLWNAAKIGAPIGAVEGFTGSNESLGDRAGNAVTGALVGAPTAAAIHGVATPFLRGLGATARYARGAAQNAANPEEAAYRSLAEKGAEDKVDFQALRDSFATKPDSTLAAQGVTEGKAADIVSRSLRGEPDADIAAAHGLSQPDVTRFLTGYYDTHPTPLNVLEMGRIQNGPGSMQTMADFARANANLYPQPEMMQRLVNRQLNQPGRANQIVENATGGAGTESQVRAAQEALPGRAASVIEGEYPGSAFETTAQRLDAQAKAAARQNYENLHAQPDVPIDENLGKLLTTPLAKGQWEQARKLAEAEGEEIPTFEEMARNFGTNPKGGIGLNMEGTTGPGLEAEGKFNLRQMALDAQIEAARKATKAKDPDVAAKAEARLAELEKVREGSAAKWETTSTGQYPGAPSSATGGSTVPVKALDYFQRALRLDAQKGGTEGNAFNTLRQRLINTLDPPPTPGSPPPKAMVPGFRDTMSGYRAGMEGQEALQTGATLKPELSNASRDILASFDNMSDPQQELFRMGFARHLQDTIRNAPDAAAAIDALNKEGAQDIINKVFKPDVAQRLMDGLQREAATSRAMEMGMNMTRNLGSGSRDALYEFSRMTPEQQQLFRQGFTRKLMDMVSNKVEGADVAKQFGSDAVKQMIQGIYPPDVAGKLINQLSTEGVTVSSLRDLFGNSTTAKQLLGQNRILEAAGTAADVALGRWHSLQGRLATKLSDQIGKQGAEHVLKILSETDPSKVLGILNKLAQQAKTTQERNAYLEAIAGSRTSILPLLAGQHAAQQMTAPKPKALPSPAYPQ